MGFHHHHLPPAYPQINTHSLKVQKLAPQLSKAFARVWAEFLGCCSGAELHRGMDQ